jgi:hypothetical protein
LFAAMNKDREARRVGGLAKEGMREAVTDAQQRSGFPLRSLRSLQDGDENRGQLFALTRVLPNARPFGLPVYVALLPAGSILVAKARAFPR